MGIELLHVGFGSTIDAQRIIAICKAGSAPIKRMVRRAEEEGRTIDLTYGRKVNTVIVLDTGHLVLAALQTETIVGRLKTPAG
mgnify:CR=1 FL=1